MCTVEMVLDGWKGGAERAPKSSLGFASNSPSKVPLGLQVLILHLKLSKELSQAPSGGSNPGGPASTALLEHMAEGGGPLMDAGWRAGRACLAPGAHSRVEAFCDRDRDRDRDRAWLRGGRKPGLL